jgi:pyruvate/2-oxoglutarate/acetoin dehydrogenase E1 component
MTQLFSWSQNKCMVTKGSAGRRIYYSIGVADIKREGSDVTIVSFGKIIKEAYAAADELAKEGIFHVKLSI